MAPEIKNGNYGRSIDIYACGVILFEMLTGHPPFDGETPAEVLMKHQLDTPDLNKVPAAIRPVVERALEKDPAKRYQRRDGIGPGGGGGLRRAAAEIGPPATPSRRRSTASPRARYGCGRDGCRCRARDSGRAGRVDVARARPGTFRDRLTELAGGLALAPLVSPACTAPWALSPGRDARGRCSAGCSCSRRC